MELKSYQQGVIKDLEEYLEYIHKHKGKPDEAFKHFWEDRIGPYNLYDNKGMQPYKNNIPGATHVCIKVPTAGGKTFIACNALHSIFNAYAFEKPKVVIWLVPWSNLLEQTITSLRNPDHPYRQKLNSLFNNRVEIYEKDDLLYGTGFNPSVVHEQLSIIVMSFASLRSRTKEDRKAYQENGNLASFANYSPYRLLELENSEETSLINVLKSLRPVLVIDESHNAESDLSVEMLKTLNPSFILDLTATPKENSNIISLVPAIALKKEHMVKLPVMVYNHHDKTEVIDSALHLRYKLEQLAREEQENGGKYIRPIVLFQAQPKTGEENTTFDKLKKQLIQAGIPEEEIKIKTAEINELKDIDLSSDKCPVRYIITINALKEGWDCPFAYVLASLADKSSAVDVEQILGRVLRQPYVMKHQNVLLNMSYVLTASVKFNETLQNIVRALQSSGFSAKDYRQKDMMDENVKRKFTEEHMDDLVTSNTGNLPKEEIEPERISYDHKNTEEVPLLKKLETEAKEEAENFDLITENESKHGQETLATKELGSKVRWYDMDVIYREKALSLRLPQFYLDVPQNLIVDTGKTFLCQESLITDEFDLAKEDIKIVFDFGQTSLSTIDVDQKNNPSYGSIESNIIRDMVLNVILTLPHDKQIKNIAHLLVKAIGDIAPITEIDIRNYVERILNAMKTQEDLKQVLYHKLSCASKIKAKINSCLENFAEKQFNKLLLLGRITAEPSWTFPEQIVPGTPGDSVRKSLYEGEGYMNDFELNVIRNLTGLSNIMFWHRNLVRGKGFALNGYKYKHYPDFILYTRSGNIILLETKGNDRDNSDSIAKLRLGKKWAALAGKGYSYLMVFNEPTSIEEADTIESAYEAIQKL